MTGLQTLPGVAAGRLVRHADLRGAFAEVWRARGSPDLEALPAVQANLSSSVLGVLRGMHFHQRQDDRWIVLSGRAFTALVDARPALANPALGSMVATSTLGPGDWVTIPPGVAHGFLALEPLELLYFVTNEYDGTDELGFAWNDPAVAIPWPAAPTQDGNPVLSPRDETNPPLAELVARLRVSG